jgi:hypothetical protein
MSVRTFLKAEFRTQLSKVIGGLLVLAWAAILSYGVPALAAATGMPWFYALGWVVLGLAISAAIIGWWLYSRSSNEPTRAEWLEMEGRFGLIDGEVTAMWQVYVNDPSRVEWNVQPDFESRRQSRPVGGGARRVERFRAEAHRAGEMVQRVRFLDPAYKVSAGAPAEDHWLSALGATIHVGSGMHGSGRDERGDSESRVMERVVDASKTMCARLAARAGN